MAYSRKTWGALGTVPRDGRPKTEAFIHHSVTKPPTYTRNIRENIKRECAAMRGLETLHMNQGWSTVGYSYVCFPSGRLYEGRGPRGLPAAQGGHNAGTLAICFVGDFSNTLPSRRARLRVYGVLRRWRSQGIRALGGHRDVFPTACPGAALYGRVRRWRTRLRYAAP